MTQTLNTVIIGTGSFIPSKVVSNAEFEQQVYFEKDQSLVESPGEEISRKFREITGIYERRWADNDINNSDMASIAAHAAVADAGIDPETTMDGTAYGIDQYNVYPKTRSLSIGINASF